MTSQLVHVPFRPHNLKKKNLKKGKHLRIIFNSELKKTFKKNLLTHLRNVFTNIYKQYTHSYVNKPAVYSNLGLSQAMFAISAWIVRTYILPRTWAKYNTSFIESEEKKNHIFHFLICWPLNRAHTL